MKKLIPVLLFAMLLWGGCATAPSDQTSDLTVEIISEKSIPRSEYAMTPAERAAAVRVFRRMRAHVLFEVVVSRTGDVEKLRVTRSLQDDFVTTSFKTQADATKFHAASKDDPLPDPDVFLSTESEDHTRKPLITWP